MKINRFMIVIAGLCCTAFVSHKLSMVKVPEYFPATVYDLSNLVEEQVELGRSLFYDPVLSRDSSISCASCHSPYNAFAHTDHDLSHGIDEQIGTRNAPALFNLAWQKSFMWDGAINHLDMQALAPITHAAEMDESLANVVRKLQDNSRYPGLFKEAFADSIVSGVHVLKALSQFQLTLVSANSKYDSVQRGSTRFTDQEQKGYALFQQNCNSCHREPLFSTYEFANNGLPLDTTLYDFGKGAKTERAQDSLLFKIPSLRNLSFTYPYMHDGRFRKLSQVLKHYSSGIEAGANTAASLRNNLPLSSNDWVDLIAFLLTLNDRSFVFDPKHQFPRNFFGLSEGLQK